MRIRRASIQVYRTALLSIPTIVATIVVKFLVARSYGPRTDYSPLSIVRTTHFLVDHRLPVVIRASPSLN